MINNKRQSFSVPAFKEICMVQLSQRALANSWIGWPNLSTMLKMVPGNDKHYLCSCRAVDGWMRVHKAKCAPSSWTQGHLWRSSWGLPWLPPKYTDFRFQNHLQTDTDWSLKQTSTYTTCMCTPDHHTLWVFPRHLQNTEAHNCLKCLHDTSIITGVARMGLNTSSNGLRDSS